jgi:hypothetical protein
MACPPENHANRDFCPCGWVWPQERPPAPILRYFAHAHLPAPMSDVAAGFSALAHDVDAKLPDGPEKAVALRKLLEAKDAAVRAALELT